MSVPRLWSRGTTITLIWENIVILVRLFFQVHFHVVNSFRPDWLMDKWVFLNLHVNVAASKLSEE